MTFDRRLIFALAAASACGATALAAVMTIDWPQAVLWGITSVGLLGCIYLLAHWVSAPLSRFTGRVAGTASPMPQEIMPRLEAAYANLSEPSGEPRFNAACLAWLEHQLAGCVDGTVAVADHTRDLATGKPGKPRTEQLIRKVDEVLTHLQHINHILCVATAPGGHRKPVDVSNLITQVSHRYTERMHRHHQSLTTCAAPSAERVPADSDALTLILDALLANAVRHTPDGGRIAVDAEQVEASGELIIHVTDNGGPAAPDGIGIPLRPDTADTAPDRLRSPEGAAVDFAARLAGRMGGTLSSGPGREGGNCFTVRLPVHQTEPSVRT